MTRLKKFVLLIVCAMGFVSSTSGISQAGVIPWVYDAVFGPVGSLRYGTNYAPAYAGYGYRGYAGYGLASNGYGTTTVAYAPTAYGNSCGCNQASYYVPSYNSGSSSYVVPSSGCATGNCSNCTTNSVSTTAGYAGSPTPEIHSNSIRDTLERINHRLDRLEYEHRQHGDYLKEKHEFQLRPFNRSSESLVPQRRANENLDTFRSGPANDFRSPKRGAVPGSDEDDPAFQLRNKPPIPGSSADEKATEDSSDQIKFGPAKDKKSPASATEDVPQSKRLEDRQTAKAVAPRQRTQSVSSPTSTGSAVASKAQKSQVKTKFDSSLNLGIVRN